MELFSVLEQEGTMAWPTIIPLDEAWFHFCTNDELVSLAPGEMIAERGRHMIQLSQMR
jgi:hypothetical protein